MIVGSVAMEASERFTYCGVQDLENVNRNVRILENKIPLGFYFGQSITKT